MNVRDLISLHRDEGTLRVARSKLDAKFEVARLLAATDGTPILVPNVSGHSIAVAANLISTRALLARALGVPPANILRILADAAASPQQPPLVESAPCQEVEMSPPDLAKLPILTHVDGDGGAYVTSGVCIVSHPEYGANAAIHRLMVHAGDRVAARIVEGRHTHSALLAADAELPVAICIGVPPHVMFASAMSPPEGIDELHVAQALAPTPMVQCRTIPLVVPADTEIVIEGRFTPRRATEGPFIDLTGTWDKVRQEPVIEIDAITTRRDPIYQALLPGMGEHKTLMGVPREANIFSAVGAVCECLDVRLTAGGCSWLHAVVCIRKQNGDDPRRAFAATVEAHPSVKRVVIVDEDIRPDDPESVAWAMATRFQASRDLTVVENTPASSLDPSAEHRPGLKTRGSKICIDATIKGTERSRFQHVAYPPTDAEVLRKMLGDP